MAKHTQTKAGKIKRFLLLALVLLCGALMLASMIIAVQNDQHAGGEKQGNYGAVIQVNGISHDQPTDPAAITPSPTTTEGN